MLVSGTAFSPTLPSISSTWDDDRIPKGFRRYSWSIAAAAAPCAGADQVSFSSARCSGPETYLLVCRTANKQIGMPAGSGEVSILYGGRRFVPHPMPIYACSNQRAAPLRTRRRSAPPVSISKHVGCVAAIKWNSLLRQPRHNRLFLPEQVSSIANRPESFHTEVSQQINPFKQVRACKGLITSSV